MKSINLKFLLQEAFKLKTGLTMLFLLLVSQLFGKDKKPNIILILADDVSPAYLGCYGGSTPTPNLDKLAAQGVRFTNAHAVSALSNPSRYSLLTGQFPGRNANVSKGLANDEPYHLGQSTTWTKKDPSIARTLKAAGYYTGYVGKWHSNFSMLEGGENVPAGLEKDDPKTTKLLADMQQKHIKVVKKISGFDHVANLQVGNLDGKGKTNPWMGHHNPEWITQGALDFIAEANDTDKPFFLHLANSIPHSPDNLVSLEQDNRYTLAGKLDKPLNCHPPRESVKTRLNKAGLNTSGPIGSNNAGAVVLDDQLAAIRKQLDDLGIADNTLIIWIADHSIYGKGTCYAAGTHVPMIMYWPGHINENTVIEEAVSLIDLFKTCVTAAGAKLPKQTIDGTDLMPLINEDVQNHPPAYQEINWFRGVVKGKYHYVAFRPSSEALQQMQNGEVNYAVDNPRRNMRDIFGDLNLPFKPAYFEPVQLYDLEVDPLERHNLAYYPAYADVLADMQQELKKYTKSIEQPYPQDVPDFMESPAYEKLIVKRKKIAEKRGHYPQGYDAERIYNYNLLDPLAH